MKNAIVKGTHRGINLMVKEDGTEMYYSTKTGKCAMGIKGIARYLGCDVKTISNQAVKFGLGKGHEMYTEQGLRMVNLIMENELNELFTAILKSRCKQSTKDRVLEIQGKYVQAGFRLQVLLEVAPEQVAKEAINHIKDESKLEEVRDHAELHGQYLRSEYALNYEGEKNELKTGLIKGRNNKACDLPWKGGRSQMNSYTKSKMATMQLMQAKGLNTARTSEVGYTKDELYSITDKVRDTIVNLDNFLDSLKSGKEGL